MTITVFSTSTTEPIPALDANFTATGAVVVIPCAASGTNSLTLTPSPSTFTVPNYANYSRFSFVAANSNTSSCSATVGTLGTLAVYKNSASGPVALVTGDIIAGNTYELVYNSALNSGAGGFTLTSSSLVNAGTVSSVALTLPALLFGVSGSPVTGSGTLAATFTTISPNSLLGNPTSGSAAPTISPLSTFMDSALGSTQGMIAYRDSAIWMALSPGISGQQLSTGGSGADPSWGATSTIGIAAAGSTTSLATILTATFNVVSTVASGTGVRYSPIVGVDLSTKNTGANALLVYPPIGGQIDALGTDTAATVATLGILTLFGVSSTQYYTKAVH